MKSPDMMPLIQRSRPTLSCAVLLTAIAVSSTAGAVVWTVDTTVDAADADLGDGVCATPAGDCSLRAAVENANFAVGESHTILFAIPGTGPHAIALTGLLPVVEAKVTIDGRSQGGSAYEGPPLIEIDGDGAAQTGDGLDLRAVGSALYGLAIHSFRRNGVVADGATITHCHVGTDSSGIAALPNRGHGIVAGDSTVIGRIDADAASCSGGCNRIVANGGAGILVGGSNVRIIGNAVGIAGDSSALGNVRGVVVPAVFGLVPITGVHVGEPGAGNVIANNEGAGVLIEGAGQALPQGIAVRANLIYDNGGLPIDLAGDGTTLNDPQDADGGPNQQQNFPVIDAISINRDCSATIGGFAPAGAAIDLFGVADGGARVFLGSAVEGGADDGDNTSGSYDIGGVGSDTTPRFSFSIAFDGPFALPELAATATGPDGSSELSPGVPTNSCGCGGACCDNGVLDPGEACDGALIGGATCGLGFVGTPICNNSVLHPRPDGTCTFGDEVFGCSETKPCYSDEDGDGVSGTPHTILAVLSCAAAAPVGVDWSEDDGGDCNDDSGDRCAAVSFPGAAELCDNCDNDCDPTTDDGADLAADACDSEDDDLCLDDIIGCRNGTPVCRDAGAPLVEACDDAGADEDCDGLVNDDDPSLSAVEGARALTLYFEDNDSDGCGGALAATRCDADGPAGTVTNSNDLSDFDGVCCGDGIIDPLFEICETGESTTCADLGMLGGDAPCGPDCAAWDLSECGDMECGNGTLDDEEACDPTAPEAAEDCRADCTRCGDGTVQASTAETCEPDLDDSCREDCTRCGDGIRNVPAEDCDTGAALSADCAYGLQACEVCTPDCRAAAGLAAWCGDLTVQEEHGEECDSVAGCTADCLIDTDEDGYADTADNCPDVANGPNTDNQADLDGDGMGDACDDDIDGDNLTNDEEVDLGTDPRNPDTDGDGVGDDVDPSPLGGAAGDSGCGCAVGLRSSLSTGGVLPFMLLSVMVLRLRRRGMSVRAA